RDEHSINPASIKAKSFIAFFMIFSPVFDRITKLLYHYHHSFVKIFFLFLCKNHIFFRAKQPPGNKSLAKASASHQGILPGEADANVY
ncbi:MAG: hypothetical protein II229_00940, partial [Clostridia bacterium]|nr:hypothetical protein [Clostridia bacterium]